MTPKAIKEEPVIPKKQRPVAPFFSLPLTRKTFEVDSPAKMGCAVQGNPKPEVTWLKNGQPIMSSSKYHLSYRLGLCTLEISRATYADTGTYSCVAKNGEGEEITVAELVIVESKCSRAVALNFTMA